MALPKRVKANLINSGDSLLNYRTGPDREGWCELSKLSPEFILYDVQEIQCLSLCDIPTTVDR